MTAESARGGAVAGQVTLYQNACGEAVRGAQPAVEQTGCGGAALITEEVADRRERPGKPLVFLAHLELLLHEICQQALCLDLAELDVLFYHKYPVHVALQNELPLRELGQGEELRGGPRREIHRREMLVQ